VASKTRVAIDHFQVMRAQSTVNSPATHNQCTRLKQRLWIRVHEDSTFCLAGAVREIALWKF
jgi:hypothetical protein